MRFSLISSLMILAIAAKADSIAYEVGSSRDFGTVDLNTGVYTEIGATPNVQLSGLGEVGGKLYAAGSNANGTLYAVNTATAGLTVIGTGVSGSSGYFTFGSTTTGLYGVGSTTINGLVSVALWSIDPTTGSASLVGPTGTTAFGGTTSLSTGSNALYYTIGASVYTISTTTGHATLLGSSFPFSSSAMVFENGTLYGALDSPCCSFYSLNMATGGATFLANETNGPALGYIVGLAPFPAAGSTIPEPACLGLAGSAFLGLGFWFCRRTNRC